MQRSAARGSGRLREVAPAPASPGARGATRGEHADETGFPPWSAECEPPHPGRDGDAGRHRCVCSFPPFGNRCRRPHRRRRGRLRLRSTEHRLQRPRRHARRRPVPAEGDLESPRQRQLQRCAGAGRPALLRQPCRVPAGLRPHLGTRQVDHAPDTRQPRVPDGGRLNAHDRLRQLERGRGGLLQLLRVGRRNPGPGLV